MKWGILVVGLIIAGAFYYFWQQSHFDAQGEPQKRMQVETETKVRMSEDDPKKIIPEGVIMEDGTI